MVPPDMLNFAPSTFLTVVSSVVVMIPVCPSFVSITSSIPSFFIACSGIADVILYPFKSNIIFLPPEIIISISWLVYVTFLNSFIVVCSVPTVSIASCNVG